MSIGTPTLYIIPLVEPPLHPLQLTFDIMDQYNRWVCLVANGHIRLKNELSH